MTIQRIQLDISSDILDKVMVFLEKLPKNKIKFDFENDTFDPKKSFNPIEIKINPAFGILKNKIVDPIVWQKKLREESDRDIFGDGSK